MIWPIPDISQRYTLKKPQFWFWFVVLLLMLGAGMLFSLLVFNISNYGGVFFYFILPVMFLWLCMFGVVLNRYEQSVTGSVSWEAETEQTKRQWQQWSRRQLAIVGNVLISPEEHGMNALLGNIADIPAYPEKSRPLFCSPRNLSSLCADIDIQLEQQYSGYRGVLQAIYVLSTDKSSGVNISESILEKWDLFPEVIFSIEHLQPLYDTENNVGVFLLLCFQNWPKSEARDASQFISAQLITSAEFVRKNNIPVQSGLGRVMSLGEKKLEYGLDILFEYNQLNKQALQDVWVLGDMENIAVEIMQYADQHQWPLPVKKPLYSIDYSFGPAGELAFPVSLAMLSEAARKTGKNQLIVYRSAQNTEALCVISSELYS